MNQASAHVRAKEPWRRYLPWQGGIEVAFWVFAFAIPAIANTMVALMDAQRDGHVLPTWQPAMWEGSSALVSLLLLPGLLALCSRWPMHADTWRRRLPLYLGASVAWSIVHVVGMVLVRKAGYLLLGEHYEIDDWLRRFAYEYLKDARTFALIVIVDHGYRWFWRRLQGEARLLDPPDDGSATGREARTERFLVRKLGREFLVAANDIEWLQAAGNYVNLRVRGRDYPLRSTIAGIAAQLDPDRFVRIHRSYIVNLDTVASIEPLDSGDARVHLHDGTALPCSRRHRDALRARLGAPAATA
ncbi:LytTR family DNA-binding domain-containing protein [Luteimonas mephitis]|uniref:LytTR family DNA-binding domain-containing protein n=1 Tax=Luteimonas mephitis TaxID=83615 RepID=UPI000403ADFB|nr:LytTR family DNA-binding domain-containing protein [Luteimonas mephitis]